ncbi:MAG TPA: tyrosine-type recombinase/integrase [Polyangiaceae bacterium]|nr:tyrosine-type recombinase/integrase [Polyangiaceae bacterium]
MSEPKNSRGGRPVKGTLGFTRDGRRQPIVTLADGKTRKRLDPFPPGMSMALMLDRTAFYAEKWSKVMPEQPAEPELDPTLPTSAAMAEWFKAWLADRVARGYTATRENSSHFRLHIAPSIGPKHVRDWTRDDLRKLSRELDGKVRANELAWKAAQNVWGTATKMCDDAAESKSDEIKCRADNPAAGVRGPDRGADTGKQFLYPSEFLSFVRHQDVPLHWRRIVAVAVYTYTRDAELRVLACSDVDVEHLSIRITKALNRRTGATKTTKGKRARALPIEPAVVALLEAMKGERAGDAALVEEMPSERDMARGLRRWLWKAGVRRPELHKATPTTRPIRFHDLRATGITWMAIRGDDPLKIQQRAGHTSFDTTQEYIRLAESMRTGFGDVFPSLPSELYESPGDGGFRSQVSITGSATLRDQKPIWRGGRDSNPRPPA